MFKGPRTYKLTQAQPRFKERGEGRGDFRAGFLQESDNKLTKSGIKEKIEL